MLIKAHNPQQITIKIKTAELLYDVLYGVKMCTCMNFINEGKGERKRRSTVKLNKGE